MQRYKFGELMLLHIPKINNLGDLLEVFPYHQSVNSVIEPLRITLVKYVTQRRAL